MERMKFMKKFKYFLLTGMLLAAIGLSGCGKKAEDDITNNYKIMLIGNIPDFSNAKSKGYYKYGYNKYGYSRKDGQTNAK